MNGEAAAKWQVLSYAGRPRVSDHPGGFWKRVRRGQSKRFGKIDIGDVDPLGEGSGAGVHIY
jgi:hypothetical protein